MKNRIYIALLFCLVALCAHAETIILRTGARVKGTIVFQNEEVVIIRNEEGARFQYPRAEVTAIMTEDVSEPDVPVWSEDTDEEITTSKKASILLELAGGAAVVPNEKAGGAASVDLLVGSHHIRDRHLFVGGGLGYHGFFMGAETYNFLPIQVAVRMPMTEKKHAPMFGVAAGYGVALSKDYLGGIYAGVDLGYRCQLNPRTALAVLIYAQFQQANVTVTSTIEGVEFTHSAGRSLVASGLKLAFYF